MLLTYSQDNWLSYFMILQNRSCRNSKQKVCEVFKGHQKGFFCDQLANFENSLTNHQRLIKKIYSDIFCLLETKKGARVNNASEVA